MALRPSQPSQATGARKYQTTGQKRLMRTAPFFPTTVRSPPVPSYSYTDANLMRNHLGRVIMGFADGYGPFGIARHIRPLDCEPRLWRRSSSSDGPKPTGSDILGLLACAKTSELKMWQGNPTPKACDPIRTAARRVRIEQAGFYATDLLNSDTAIAASMATQISDRLEGSGTGTS